MEYTSVFYLFSVAILFSLFQSGTCYKCYTCAGAISAPQYGTKIPLPVGVPLISTCIDPPDTRNLPTTECIGDENACVKFISDVRGVKLVIRGCLNPNSCKDDMDECNYCRDDLCNSSTNIYPTWITTGIISLILINNLL